MLQKKKLPDFEEVKNENLRIINLRYFLFGALFMILGIILAKSWGFVVTIILFTAVFLATTVFFLIKQRRRLVLAALICIICVYMGAGTYSIKYTLWQGGAIDSTKIYELSGELCEGFVLDENNQEFSGVLKNIKLDGKGFAGSCYIKISYTDYRTVLEFADIGDIITFNARLNNIDFLDERQNITYSAIKNIRYSASSVDEKITLIDKPTPLTAAVRQRLAQQNERWLGTSYGAIATAMLTGDTSDLSKDVGYYFSGAGIYHILSVSGSHITFISAFLMLLMSKIKIKRYKKSIILSTILVLYLAICNFVAPAARSVIMGILASFGASIGQRNDSLSNLSVAAIILLLINPLLLFDGSFQLSFSATIGIIFLTRPITRLLERLPLTKNMPQTLTQAIAISFAAQLGTIVVSMYRLQSFSFYAVIANVTLMPVLMAAFTISFMAGFISLALPFLGFLNAISYPLIHLTIEGSKLFAMLPFSLIIIFATAVMAWVYLTTLFISSGFVMLNKKSKRISLIAFSAACLLLAVSFNINQAFSIRQPSVHSFNTKIGIVDLFTTKKGEVYLVGDLRDYGILEILNNNKAKRIDALIMTNNSKEAFKIANALVMKYSIKHIYLVDDVNMEVAELTMLATLRFLQLNKPNDFDGLTITLYNQDNRVLGLLAEIEGKRVMQLNSTAQDFLELISSIDLDLLHCYMYKSTMPKATNIVANYYSPDLRANDNGRYGVNFTLNLN